MKIILELGEENGKIPAKLRVKIFRIQILLLEIKDIYDFASGIIYPKLAELIKNRTEKTKLDVKQKAKVDLYRVLKVVGTYLSEILKLVDVKNYEIKIELNYEMLREPEIISAIGAIQILPNTKIVPSKKSSIKIASELKFTKIIKLIFLIVKEKFRIRT